MLEWKPKDEEECRRAVLAARGNGPQSLRAKIALGNYGEEIWRHLLIEANYRMFMLSKIDDGGAPMMLGKDKIIAPDFDCYGGCSAYRYSVYIDSKVKGGPILFRLKKQVRHGINERNYRHYMKCAELADKPCALAITELFTDYDDPSTWSGCLLLQSLTKLGTPEYSIPGTEPEAKAYWQRKRFRPVGAFGLMSLNEIARGAVVPNLKAHFDEVFDNREQGNLF